VVKEQFHILIIDETPDFAKSLGNLIIDVLEMKTNLVEYAFNLQDGLKLVSQTEFHFVFMRVNFTKDNVDEIRSLFREESVNPSLRFIALTFQNEPGSFVRIKEDNEGKYLIKDEIDVDELASIFEIMR